MRFAFAWPLVIVTVGACGGGGSSGSPPANSGTVVVFDFAADLHTPDHFFDFPFPSDLRLTSSGAPDMAGLANPSMSAVLEGLRGVAMDRKGFPQMPVAWFQFTAAIPAQDSGTTIAADKASSILLVDVDAASSTPGALIP